jgi:hypothetical protein
MTRLLSNKEVLSIFSLLIFFAVPLLCNRHYLIAVDKNHLYTTMFFVKSLSAVILAFALGHATHLPRQELGLCSETPMFSVI